MAEKLFVAAWAARVGVGACCTGVAGADGGAGAEAASVESTEGSAGGGPSSAQRRDSYFERMNESILLQHSQLNFQIK